MQHFLAGHQPNVCSLRHLTIHMSVVSTVAFLHEYAVAFIVGMCASHAQLVSVFPGELLHLSSPLPLLQFRAHFDR